MASYLYSQILTAKEPAKEGNHVTIMEGLHCFQGGFLPILELGIFGVVRVDNLSIDVPKIIATTTKEIHNDEKLGRITTSIFVATQVEFGGDIIIPNDRLPAIDDEHESVNELLS
jgi:hypothetical protein